MGRLALQIVKQLQQDQSTQQKHAAVEKYFYKKVNVALSEEENCWRLQHKARRLCAALPSGEADIVGYEQRRFELNMAFVRNRKALRSAERDVVAKIHGARSDELMMAAAMAYFAAGVDPSVSIAQGRVNMDRQLDLLSTNLAASCLFCARAAHAASKRDIEVIWARNVRARANASRSSRSGVSFSSGGGGGGGGSGC